LRLHDERHENADATDAFHTVDVADAKHVPDAEYAHANPLALDNRFVGTKANPRPSADPARPGMCLRSGAANGTALPCECLTILGENL
jgi:hypothetical protein